MSQLSGRAQTVLGPIDPASLGITLMHEHLLIDESSHVAGANIREAGPKGRALRPVTIENLWHVRRDWVNLDDGQLLNEDEAIEEALIFKRAGGQTLVDVTTLGLGRDPMGLARIARATRLNIIMGAGYYSMEVGQAGLEDKSQRDITDEIVHDVQEGFGWPVVRAGIIGEIGCSWPMHASERKVLRAAAAAQRQTGAPLMVHPGRNPAAPSEIIAVIAEAGGDIERMVMAHLDRTIFDYADLARLADTGCYLEYDLFGQESSYYPIQGIDMPNDAKRVDHIQWLINRGYLGQVLVAHDIDRKWGRRKYGGHGLAHLIEDVVPIMRRKGMSISEIETIFIENPRRILAFR